MENLFSGCYICNNYYLSLAQIRCYILWPVRGVKNINFFGV